MADFRLKIEKFLCLVQKLFAILTSLIYTYKQRLIIRKKKFKMADSKKVHFSKSPILKIFLRKFLRLVLALVGLYDAKGIDVAQSIWP